MKWDQVIRFVTMAAGAQHFANHNFRSGVRDKSSEIGRGLLWAHSPVRRTTHLIHDVLKWQKSLDEGKVMNRAALAKKLGITRAAVTRNLHLVELIPEIQNFLLGLKKNEEIRAFSLNRMRRLAHMKPEKQREWLSGITA